MPAAIAIDIDLDRVLPAMRDLAQQYALHDDRVDRQMAQLRIIARQRERAAKSLARELELSRTKASTPSSRRDEAARARALAEMYPSGTAVIRTPTHAGKFTLPPGETVLVLALHSTGDVHIETQDGKRVLVPAENLEPTKPKKSATGIVRKSYQTSTPEPTRFGFYYVDRRGAGSVRAAAGKPEAEQLRNKMLRDSPGSYASSVEVLDPSWACECNDSGECHCHQH